MEELDLKELISMFLEKKLLIILVIIIFAIMGAIYTLKFIVPEYEASISLVLVQLGTEATTDSATSISTTDITINSKLVENYREIAKSRIVADTVKQNLHLDIPTSEIQENIAVNSISDTELIRVTVTNKDPKLAYDIATEFAKVFADKVEGLYNIRNVHILDEAQIPQEPSNIHLSKNVLIFAFVGAILVFGYILLINMLDTTVKSDIDIEKALNLPVLASIALTDDNYKKKSKYTKNAKLSELDFKNIEREINKKDDIDDSRRTQSRRNVKRKGGKR
ncbi:MAG TPA: hypothetical protein IAD08_05110 [Candidatus Scatovivens faecipullorum]|nr:hypothetical protein [Candidatus Scatovivens faecipullorum]